MFHIIQSNDVNRLFDDLLMDYQQKSSQIFDPFIVIVPSKVMGDWLKKQVADQTGISTLVTAEFWGRYQWILMQNVLQAYAKFHPREALRVPEVAVLSKNVMQWRLFGYFNAEKQTILADSNHPLYPLLEPLIGLPVANLLKVARFSPKKDPNDHIANLPKWLRKKSFLDKSESSHGQTASSPQDFQSASDDQRLWQLASDMASMLNRYMTYRPEWLNLWGKNLPVNVKQMIAKKDELNLYMAGIKFDTNSPDPSEDTPDTSRYVSPEWLTEHYEQLEIAQRYLWQKLFSDNYQYRQAIETQFWHALNHPEEKTAQACRATLPSQLTLFTIQQLPQTELNMMARLAKFTDIKLLHYNPSEMFWADIVDKTWLAQQRHINPEAIYFKDYGHTLLSRFGKQSREVFAMLADFSGNDYVEDLGDVAWEDKFVKVLADEQAQSPSHDPTLLARLQQDILILQEKDTQHASKHAVEDLIKQIDDRRYRPKRDWQFDQIDNSLSFHACYSMVRQLEVLRTMIIGWLNYVDKPYLLQGDKAKTSATNIDTIDSTIHAQAVSKNLSSEKDTANNNYAKKTKKSAKNQKQSRQYSLFDLITEAENPDNATAEVSSTTLLTKQNRRSLSDILVLLPDIEAQQTVIESIFPKGVGTDGYDLPAKVTGVTSKDINQLWAAITGFFTLLQTSSTLANSGAAQANGQAIGQASGQSTSRFDRATVFDWLMLPPLLESYGLTLEQMRRGCELLALAGFARGFDEAHLATTLHEQDDDYRYSFAYALERLVAGLLMPNAQTTQFGEYINRYQESEKILPLPQVQMGDSAVIAVLCDIYTTIDRLRDIGGKLATAKNWLIAIERFIHEKFEHFEQTNALNSIWAALNAFEQNIQANQRHTHGHHSVNVQSTPLDPDKLPLKLGFILASIESELASQQVSAEPSGVITFGRIGAVRNLPYKLVVMLNLNLSNFPNRDKASRYDLMQAGVGERGDRFKEDDELGAFLDAILSAKEACWLFYDGASTSDTHEHLPASPVEELLNFLQGEVEWQSANNNDPNSDPTAEKNFAQNKSKLIREWLVTKHPALPFESNYFYTPTPKHDEISETNKLEYQIKLLKHAQKSLYPPAPLWYSVFEQVYQTTKNNDIETVANMAQDKIELWQKRPLTAWLKNWDKLQQGFLQDSFLPQSPLQQSIAKNSPELHDTFYNKNDLPVMYANLSQIIREVQHPGKTFIQAQHIHISRYENDVQNIEPIELDTLARYQINASLLQEILTPVKPLDSVNSPNSSALNSLVLNNLVFSNALPAGVSRYISIHAQHQKIQQDTHTFWQKLQNIANLANNEASGANLARHAETNAFSAIAKVVKTFDPIDQNIPAATPIATIITPCQDQRFAVAIALSEPLDTGKATNKTTGKTPSNLATPYDSWQNCIITAHFPSLQADLDNGEKIDTGYWINYLPTSGREKYQVQFWLSHLSWQVARHTTPQQVAQGDGFSLWQFSDKKTYYLPPIAYAQAYAWLQDWLVFWQWCKTAVAVLPPSVVLPVLAAMQKVDATDTPPDIFTALTKTRWKENAYNQNSQSNQSKVVYDDDPTHPIWAFLLKDKDLNIILPFISTWGERLYSPILSQMLTLENDITEQATPKPKNDISEKPKKAKIKK